MQELYELAPLGHLRSPYHEKFGIPRQSGLAPAATATLTLRPDLGPDSVRDLATFSHLWLTFIFHQVAEQDTRLLVRPPRLGGNEKTGVFATRSPFRPNRLGLSLVELLAIDTASGRVTLTLGGIDLLDGTPVLDLKPYLPFAEALPHARAGFATESPPAKALVIASDCQAAFDALPAPLRALISQTLALDPRPAYHRDPVRSYTCALAGHQITFRADEQHVTLSAIEKDIAQAPEKA
ncbi:MAG: tRNA (N6-threonylcarbamoyladenosine(37)-N6)-methyltransferase TrmO [Verrucomicrobiales bacterium]